MTPYLLTFAVAAALGFGLSPVVRQRTARRRFRHGRSRPLPEWEKPRVGGLIIFAAFCLAPFIAAQLSPAVAALVEPKWRAIAGLCGASFLVFLLGYMDDRRELTWQAKAGGLTAAALVLYVLGYRLGEVSLPGGGTWHLGVLDLPATVLWIFLVTNAVNLLDGHDGVAAGVTVLAAATLGVIAADLDHGLVAVLFVALAGAVAGFLPFNFPAASKHLGDSGALLLGVLLAALSISGFVDETGRVPLYIPIVALGVPLLDTGLAFARRLLNGRHPLHGDEDHIHHRMARLLGMRPKPVALALYAYSALFALMAFVLYALRGSRWAPAAVPVLLLLVVVFIVRLGYHDTLWQSRGVRRLRRRGRVRTAPRQRSGVGQHEHGKAAGEDAGAGGDVQQRAPTQIGPVIEPHAAMAGDDHAVGGGTGASADPVRDRGPR
jgi:UDP-GlcNAc:undecaprenyl-phosphate GlcNAc-1-phosphate transferase